MKNASHARPYEPVMFPCGNELAIGPWVYALPWDILRICDISHYKISLISLNPTRGVAEFVPRTASSAA